MASVGLVEALDDIQGALSGYRITSVTPTALRSDSRTLKQAVSVVRAGATSSVIEGLASQRDFSHFGISVRSLRPAPAHTGNSQNTEGTSKSRRTLRSRIRSFLPRNLVELRQFLLVLIALVRDEWWPLYRALPRSDLYVLHAMNFLPAVWLKSKMTGTPYIYDAHDFYRGMSQTESFDPFTRNWILPLYAFLDRMAARNAAAVMTVSEGVAALYDSADGVKSVLIRNCHDPRNDTLPTRRLREVIGIGPDKFLVVAIGNAKPGASTSKLIDLLESLDESIHIAFVGKNFESEKGFARPAHVAARVHFVDAVPADQVVPFIGDADCSIILYFAETEDYEAALPNRFFQSVAASLPLIYPKLHEMHKVAQLVDFGIGFRPDDAEEMKSSIKRVFEDVRLLNQLRNQAEHARKTLTWEVEERLLISLIRSLV